MSIPSIPVRLTTVRHRTDEEVLGPMRTRLQQVARLALATQDEEMVQVSSDINHLLCAIVEQRGDLIRMNSVLEKGAAGIYRAALVKLHKKVFETGGRVHRGKTAASLALEALDELVGVAHRILAEVELQVGGEGS